MSTRQKTDFEKSLVEALKSNNVANAISDAILNSITKKLAEKFNLYDAKIASLEAEIQLLKSNSSNQTENTTNDNQKKLEQKVDILHQQAKKNNIRLMGVKEIENENTSNIVKELFTNKLKTSVNNEIIAAYRVGKTNNNRPRHIVVTFNDTKIRNTIYNRKKLLKGTSIVMKEDLTVERLKLVKQASDEYGFKNVWTVNGTIFVKTENGIEKFVNI